MQKLSEKQRLENENAALKALLSETLLEIEQYKQQIKGNRSMIKFSVRYEQWLEEIKGQIQENTRENYISIYKNHLGPYFGDRMLDEIAPQEIERYYTTRSAMHLNIHTIHRHHANLHSFFKYAHRHDWIAENPMAKVERPKDTYKFMAAYYHADQMRALFDAAAHDKIFPAIFLCGVMGLRRSEIAGLKWDAVSFSDNTIQIRRKAIRDRSSRKDVVSTSLKTQSSYRTLVMPEPVRSFLLKLRAQHRNSDFILVDEKGQRISLNTVTNRFRALLQREGLPKIRFHDLRHPYVKHTTKIFSLRLMDFQAQAYPDARRKTRGACQLLRVGQSRSPVRPLCNRKRFSCLPPQSKMSWILYAISMRLSGYTSTRSISSSASSVVSVSASKIALDASFRLSCRACSSCFCFACANTAA